MLGALLVEPPEGIQREIHLAPHLHGGRRLPLEHERDRADGAHVGRHVLAAGAVAARRALRQAAVLVGERDGQAVDLWLAHHGEAVRLQQRCGAPVPGGQLIIVEGVAEAEHRQRMDDLAELGRGCPTDALGRRLRRDELGVRGLQRLELAHEPVILGVADERTIEDVVAVVVEVDLLMQLADPVDGGLVRHGWLREVPCGAAVEYTRGGRRPPPGGLAPSCVSELGKASFAPFDFAQDMLRQAQGL